VPTATRTPAPPGDRPTTTGRVVPWAGTAARLLLAGVWVWAGLAKIGDPAASVRAVRAYQLLPEWAAKAVGYGLPYLELGLAALLLAGLATRAAAAVSAGLLAVFLAGIVSAAARGLQIECGCFGGGGELGAGQSTAYTGEIVRDAALLAVSGFLVWAHRTRYAADDAVRTAGADPVASARVGRRRTAEAQRRLADLAERRRREGERRVGVASVLAMVALVAVTGAGIGIQAARIPAPTGPTPSGATIADGVVVGEATAPVTLDVYEDPQCPVCAQFEEQVGPTITGWVDTGRVKVRYHVISFLDRASTTKYSSRAANALYASAAAGPEVFARYHRLLFAEQPAEGSAGLTDDQLVELAEQAGAGSAAAAIRAHTYADHVARATEQSSKDGVTGTPAVFVNGTPLEQPTKEAVTAAVEAAG
jgi:protein-disulfide isomerase/uncharacterized membrane protein YphA (DoxX/SURF4 family)